MNIQIFGVKKCFNTQKSERYFKERKIKYQFIDLSQKALSKGELESVKNSIGINNLINIKAKEYKMLNLDSIRSDIIKQEILFNNPRLYNTPIVRNGKVATIGYNPEAWEQWE
ncbi:MAG: ArsC family transcriptional regulator [Clostridiaceae bacterium]|nr:ArsC family transcriptional regulator [Clostridiaceae bacterium]